MACVPFSASGETPPCRQLLPLPCALRPLPGPQLRSTPLSAQKQDPGGKGRPRCPRAPFRSPSWLSFPVSVQCCACWHGLLNTVRLGHACSPGPRGGADAFRLLALQFAVGTRPCRKFRELQQSFLINTGQGMGFCSEGEGGKSDSRCSPARCERRPFCVLAPSLSISP